MHSLNRPTNVAYAAGKSWQNAGIGIQIVIFASGVVALFNPAVSPTYPPIAFVCAAILAAIKMRASYWKGQAESLKRVHEFYDSFGGTVPSSLLADLELSTPEKLPASVLATLDEGLRFASVSEAGARRALENLQESAWWSKDGAATARNLLGSIFIVVLVLALMILVAVAVDTNATAIEAKNAVGRIVASSLICIFSLNMLPAVWALHRFATKAQEIDAECDRRLARPDVNLVDGIRLISEYQLSRASAPLLPTFLWRWKRDKKNQVWNRHKARRA